MIVAQLTMEFEIEKLLGDSRGALRRCSELSPTPKIDAALPPTDPHVNSLADVERLTGQNLAILQRLRNGPATNGELAAIALKYTSRISDLRKHGVKIEAKREEHGIVTYRLLEECLA